MQRWHSLPAAVYELLDRNSGTVLLESGPAGGVPACSRLFLSPQRMLTANDAASLNAMFGEIQSAVDGGYFAAGYFSYECGQYFEPKAAVRSNPPRAPLAWFGIYPECCLFDHQTGAFLYDGPLELAKLVAAPLPAAQAVDVQLEITEDDYAEKIAAIQELICAGDVYQLNFTFPMHFKLEDTPAALYRTLRYRQPVDYGAFLHCNPDHRILSFSPELFFRVEPHKTGHRIVTRPMKGTAPRGRFTAEDLAKAQWLRNDAKNRSENVMIVDLLRNDLGRLCKFGSVQADELFAVERHASLWQMTSTISGELRPEISWRDIFRALFPSGSVTGAPKVHAMQLLAQLEGKPRGVYTGAIGYFSRDETIFNVAIRTVEIEGRAARMGVGSGIVIDSTAADEFAECALKAQFLTSTPPHFNLIETMLWDGEYPLLDLHLDRLEDSAGYFGFACEREEVRVALLSTADAFGNHSPRRVRLTLGCDGGVEIASEILLSEGLPPQPLRAFVSSTRTDARDRFLFHKTTNRSVYNETFRRARADGFADAIFLNREGQVTEGAVSNIFIEQNGRWATPPIECGLLGGVYRRHLLATRPDIQERILHLEDLKAAEGVYMSNAVRGLRRVTIDWQYHATEDARVS